MIAKKGAIGIILAVIILAVIVIGSVVYFSGSKSSSSSISAPSQESTPSAPTQPSSAPTSTSTQTTPTTAAIHEVKIKDFKFVPADITVKVGNTIKWTNEDSAAHTATASDGTFDTDRLTRGESASHTFTSADVGTHAYICSIHPSMKGSVTVTSN